MRPKVILKKNYRKINWNMRFVHLLVKTTRSKMNKPVAKKKREKIRDKRAKTYYASSKEYLELLKDYKSERIFMTTGKIGKR